MLILSDLELPALSYIAAFTVITGYQNIMHTKWSSGLVESDLSLLKAYEGPLSYAKGNI